MQWCQGSVNESEEKQPVSGQGENNSDDDNKRAVEYRGKIQMLWVLADANVCLCANDGCFNAYCHPTVPFSLNCVYKKINLQAN